MLLCVIICISFVACTNSQNFNDNQSNFINSNGTPDNPNGTIIPDSPPEIDYPKYPEYVVATEGVNKYQSCKIQAPEKTVDVVEYQNYAIAQIDAYLTAIQQDPTVKYSVTHLNMQILKTRLLQLLFHPTMMNT